MALSSFIKKLYMLGVIFGGKGKKLGGVSDSTNTLAATGVVWDSVAKTITFTNETSLPAWLTPGKFFRTYDGVPKTTVSSTALNYVLNCVLTPDPVTNDGVLFQVLSVSGNTITVDDSGSGATPTNHTELGAVTLEGRIAIVINDPTIARINGEGSTVYNAENQTTTGIDDGSGVAAVFADHFHAGDFDAGRYIVKYANTTLLDLSTPIGAPYSPDGIAVADGEKVLFTGLTNKTGLTGRGVYKAQVSGGNLTGWEKVIFGQSPAGDCIDGDKLIVTYGTTYAENIFQCIEDMVTGADVVFINYTPADIRVYDEGVLIESDAEEFNFVGTNVTVTSTGPKSVQVVIGGVESVSDDSNGHVTVNNTDPVNPIVEFDGVTVDGITITGTGLAASPLTANAVIYDILYTDLVTAIGASTLVKGSWYRITDYQTVHQIPDTVDINTAVVEPLIVMALDLNKISNQAWSESFPQDEIYYDYSMNLAEDGTTPRPGFITYRRDTKRDIEFYCDFRNYKVRRYNHNITTFDADPTKIYYQGEMFSVGSPIFRVYYCYRTAPAGTTFSNADYFLPISIHNPAVSTYVLPIYTKAPVAYWTYLPSMTAGLTVASTVDNNIYTSLVNNVPSAQPAAGVNWALVGSIYLSVHTSYIDHPILAAGKTYENIHCGKDTVDVCLLNDATGLEIGSNASRITCFGVLNIKIGNSCSNIMINEGARLNEIKDRSSDVIVFCSTSGRAERNYLGYDTKAVLISSSCTSNWIEGWSEGIVMSTGVARNRMFAYNFYVTLGVSCRDNNIGQSNAQINVFKNLVDSFFGTTIRNIFIGEDNVSIIMQSFTQSVTLGDSCSDLKFNSHCSNIILPNGSLRCEFTGVINFNNTASPTILPIYSLTFKDSYYDFTGVDLAAATLLNTTYNKTIFTRSDGTIRMSYVDNLDNTIYADIND